MRTPVYSACIVALQLCLSGCLGADVPRSFPIALSELIDDRCGSITASELQPLSDAAAAAFRRANADGEIFSICASAKHLSAAEERLYAQVQFVPASGGDVRSVHEVRCHAVAGASAWDCSYFKSERILLIGGHGVSFNPEIEERTARKAAMFLVGHSSSASVDVPRCGEETNASQIEKFSGAHLRTVRSIYYFDGSLLAGLSGDDIELKREVLPSGEEAIRIRCWYRVVV